MKKITFILMATLLFGCANAQNKIKAEIMKSTVIINGKSYSVTFENNPTANEVYTMLPMNLDLTPYSDLEYSGRLPKTPVYDGSPVSTRAKRGTITYCKEYNSFVIVLKDHDDPFREVLIAIFDGEIPQIRGSNVKAEILRGSL